MDCGDKYNVWAVGDSGRVARTSDGGNSWDLEESSVSVTLERVDFLDTLNGWAVGEAGAIVHYGAGIWVRETSNYQFSISNYQLSIYPNPFTTSTQIILTLSRLPEHQTTRVSETKLRIYDVTGRLVKDFSLPTAYSLPPTEVIWDGKGNGERLLPGGVYFITLRNQEKAIDIQKVIKIGGKK